jgi:dephospho-CoA kinase
MIVGLTGGIATGKSTVARALAELGLRVLDADVIARDVVEPGTEGLRQIVAVFGDRVLLPDGTLDRGRLGDIIFSDAKKREQLNDIVHPLVRKTMWGEAQAYVQGDARRIVVLDIPLLFEGNTHVDADVSVLIYAPLALQLARLMKRNDLAEADARRRIDAQLTMETKLQMADVIVYNTGDAESVSGLVAALLEELQRLADVGARADGMFDRGVVTRTEIRL